VGDRNTTSPAKERSLAAAKALVQLPEILQALTDMGEGKAQTCGIARLRHLRFAKPEGIRRHKMMPVRRWAA